jgi:hypothetical protein
LTEQLKDQNSRVLTSSLFALSLAYAGSQNDEVIGNLMSILIARNDGVRSKFIESSYLILYILWKALLCWVFKKMQILS